ncbi:hypothetical protein IEQ_04783 [Bacillus cereus BAG6X1-2]|nr:hypothetical protein IEQ_04783 [Bacillus cereus BAG6X1-2]
MRLDIMTDIETLGTNSDSTIIQISAIAFDIETGEYHEEFNRVADISKNVNPIQVTGATLQWWSNTNIELYKQLLNSGMGSSEKILLDFNIWLKNLSHQGDLYLWGNGILFDNKMIQHQFELLGLTYPIFYKNDRDVRTIVDLASKKLGVSEKELKKQFEDENLVHHNAFDDVKYQINLVAGCYKTLIK